MSSIVRRGQGIDFTPVDAHDTYAPNYVNPASPQLPSYRFSTNYGLLRLAGSMPPTRTGLGRHATPSLLPSSMHGNSGKGRRLPLLDFTLPFVDDPPVVASQPRRSMQRCVPLPNRSERHVGARGPYNKSLHPTVSSVTAVACCPGHAATAAPAAPAGELNRYTRGMRT